MNKDPSSSLSRRKVFAGAGAAGAAGALAAVATLLPASKEALPPPTAQPADAAERGGYQVTEHVLRYYQTARV